MCSDRPNLGIIAGGGLLPGEVARAAQVDGRHVHIIGIDGEADPGVLAEFPHDFVKWGEVGKLFSLIKKHECRELVVIGKVRRPDLSDLGKLRLDLGALKILPFAMKLKVGGDNEILTKIAQLFEDKGHRICSVLDVVPALAASEGRMTTDGPGEDDKADIDKGIRLIGALGPFDVGQAAVVVRGHVIAVEGAEGTDEMLKRAATLRQWGRKERCGVLVKAPKPRQDRRLDLPTIGPKTLELVQAANLSGIAVASGETLIAQKDEVLRQANASGLFLSGVTISREPEGE